MIQPLYRRVLGPAWDALPPAIQALHGSSRTQAFTGRAQVDRGAGFASRIASWAFGFPPPGAGVALAVTFERSEGRETWRRTFGGHAMTSHQHEGKGAWAGLLVERFGPVTAGLALTVAEGRLRMAVVRWTLFGVPMPLGLAPAGDACEFEEDGTFQFDVGITHPLTGPLVRYRGWLRAVGGSVAP